MSAKESVITAVTFQDGCLAGIVTDGDLRRNIDNLMSRFAGEVAMRNPITVCPGMLAAEALALMEECKISVLLVVDEQDCPVGILHVHDCLRAGVA